jgi:hypothetical protein
MSSSAVRASARAVGERPFDIRVGFNVQDIDRIGLNDALKESEGLDKDNTANMAF